MLPSTPPPQDPVALPPARPLWQPCQRAANTGTRALIHARRPKGVRALCGVKPRGDWQTLAQETALTCVGCLLAVGLLAKVAAAGEGGYATEGTPGRKAGETRALTRLSKPGYGMVRLLGSGRWEVVYAG